MSIDHGKLNEIFSEAMEKASPEERERFLAGVCGQDAELRRQIDSLLLAESQSGDYLKQSVITPNAPPIGEGPGSIIGRYKLLQQIGEGGFGVVFMAGQQEPVRRMVALKIIKAGMDTREVVARFEAERQALALMDHPNIARVLDGGATVSGRPYFVMELVKSITVTEFCKQRQLTIEARLKLFMKVCAGVHHAHQKGIIHRDLKPSNVLVTLHDGEPVPKVIDFGIVKAIGQQLTDKTLFTRFEQLMGTPAYMSPEQAEWSGLDIDTRSDLYRAAMKIKNQFTNQPLLEASIRATVGDIYRFMGETDKAEPHLRSALEIRNRILGPDHPDTMYSRVRLGLLYQARNMPVEALQMQQQVVEADQRVYGPDKPETLEDERLLAEFTLNAGQADETVETLRRVLEKQQRNFAPDYRRNTWTMAWLGYAYTFIGRVSEAAEIHEEALRLQRHHPTEWSLAAILGFLADDYWMLGDCQRAIDLWSEELELDVRRWGPENHRTLSDKAQLLTAYGAMGWWASSLSLSRELVRSTNSLKRSAEVILPGALSALLTANTNAYRAFALLAVAHFADTTNSDWVRQVGEVCLLVPDSVPNLKPVFKLVELAPRDSALLVDKIDIGMTQYRRGSLAEALKWLEAPSHSATVLANLAGYLCAMIHFRQGDTVAARADLEEAAKRMAPFLRSGNLGDDWHEYGRVAVIRAEAERMILGRQVSPPIDPASLLSARKAWEPVRRRLNQGDRLAGQTKWPQARDEYLTALRDPVFNWEAAERLDGNLAFKMGLTFLLARDYTNHALVCRHLLARVQEYPDPDWALLAVKTCFITESGETNELRRQAVAFLPLLKEDDGGKSLVREMSAYRLGRYEEAVQESNAAEKSNGLGTRATAQIFRALVLGKSGRVDEGKKELAQAEAHLGQHLTTLTGDYWWDLALCQLALDEAHRLFGDAAAK